MLEKIEEKIRDGGTLSEEEFDALRALRERIADIQDIASGRLLELSDVELERSAGSNGFAIVVGHTNLSKGATATSPISAREYPWNRDLAEKVHAICRARNITSRIFYRDGIGIRGAYRQVAAWGAAFVVELHFNAFNGRAHGTETLFDADRNAGSKAWAQRLQDAMLSGLQLRDRGLKERDPGDRGYASVSALNIPSALIEPFFGDNPSDAYIGHTGKDDLAEAVADAAAAQISGS